jgi:hypothetical protein
MSLEAWGHSRIKHGNAVTASVENHQDAAKPDKEQRIMDSIPSCNIIIESHTKIEGKKCFIVAIKKSKIPDELDFLPSFYESILSLECPNQKPLLPQMPLDHYAPVHTAEIQGEVHQEHCVLPKAMKKKLQPLHHHEMLDGHG